MKSIANKISPANSEVQAITLTEEELQKDKVSVISFINAHAYTMANSDIKFKNCLLGADLLFRDGIGAKILLKKNTASPLAITLTVPI